MSKVKQKKQNIFIDMTAMSDVTVLLLTFFMLTATFLPNEPIRVTTPASVVEIKIPDANLMTILVKPEGDVYINLDLSRDRKNVLEAIGETYGINFSPEEVWTFANQEQIGVPIAKLQEFLRLPEEQRAESLKNSGIPTDSLNNQLKVWVQHVRKVNSDIGIAVKADRSTPYPVVKNVMNTLVEIKENRFNLITTLRSMPEGY